MTEDKNDDIFELRHACRKKREKNKMRKVIKKVGIVIAAHIMLLSCMVSAEGNDNTELIKRIGANTYQIQIDEAHTLAAEKIAIKADSTESVEMAMENEEIPAEVKAAIQEKIEKGAKSVEVYLPVEETDSGKARSRTETSYFTYNKTKMKAVVLTSTYLSTGFKNIETGKNAKQAASTIANIALTAKSVTSKTVGISTSGISILKDFLKLVNLSGPQKIVPSVGDYVQLNIAYDDVDKFVYANINNRWTLGLIAKKITLRKVSNCQYYKNTGKAYRTSEKTVTSFMYSQHYKDPNALALRQAKRAMSITETINWKYSWTDTKKIKHEKSFKF